MPNRIIKESICTSDNLDKLTAFEETVFYRLIVNCDDYGRMDARPRILASKLFPLKNIRDSQMADALRRLTSAELVTTYEVDGKPFLQMNTWNMHQRVRESKEKYPGNPSAASCGESRRVAASCGLNPIQSESESNPNPKPNPNARATAAASEPFALTDEEVHASLAIDQRIEDACRQWGLPCSPGNLMQAREMVREYGEEWLMRAIQIAGENHPTWGYVRGVLQKAKQNGSMELPKTSKPGKTVSAQQYTQRDYTEGELLAVSGDLIAEALEARR